MIYILEDDDNIRKLVGYALKREGYQTEDFPEPSVFWKALDREIPELLLLDIMLPKEDGLSILRKLRGKEIWSEIPVIMLTAKGSEYDKSAGLDLGADDYIAKPFGIVEMVSRVRAVLRRAGKKAAAKTPSYSVGVLQADPDRHIVKVEKKEVSLSNKEYSLLLILLEAEGKVIHREELLSRVWGEFYGESRTLDVHIRKLRVKLGAAGEYIQTVKGVGYRLEA